MQLLELGNTHLPQSYDIFPIIYIMLNRTGEKK
jgi:hypothetical protein